MTDKIFNQTLYRERETTRTYMFQLIASKMQPNTTWQAVRDNLKDSTSYVIFQMMLIAIQPYTTQIGHDQWDEAHRRAIQVQEMTVVLARHFEPVTYNWLLGELDDILLKNISSQDSCSDTVRKIKVRLDEYAERLYNVLRDTDDGGDPDKDLQANVIDSGLVTPFLQKYPAFWVDDNYPTFAGWETIHVNARKVGKSMLSSQLDQSVLRYLLNQDLGSCGMYAERLSGSVLMAPLFSIDTRNRAVELAAVYGANIVLSEAPEDAEDEYQQHLEERMRNYVRSKSWNRFQHEASFRSISPTVINTPAEPQPAPGPSNQTGNQSQPGGSSFRGQTSQNAGNFQPFPPPPPPAPQAQPQIPDDTNYIPDTMLEAKAKRYTAKVRAKPAHELFHDHMTRFGVNDEAPRALTWSQVISGRPDFDYRVETSARGVKNTYMVTYTRQSRKPIFNVITGPR